MKELVLKFDPNTIEHLGISLYSKLPSVLAELVSNSWDADADNVTITFVDNSSEKEIHFVDDGDGMTFEELNEKYLVIGRNRRKETNKEESCSGRKIIGKKGLGKLSVFGICNIIEVISVKDNLKNHFIMNLSDIKASKTSSYSPEIKIRNENTNERNGTTIILKGVRRKSDFDLNDIALSLSKKFQIFDKMSVNLINSDNSVHVTNELKFENLKIEFEWVFPDKRYDENYEFWEQVSGKIITLVTPVKDTEMKGVYLTSRGKIVSTASFYGMRDNDGYFGYTTGYLAVDFIDEFDEDVISTDRHSLNWEHDKTKELQSYLHTVIRKIGGEWKRKRGSGKKQDIKDKKDIDIDKWQSDLPTYEKELSNKIINPILESTNFDIEESTDLISNVIDKFENKTFKEYASHIADISKPEDIPLLLKLMDAWKAVEAKQFKDLAYARIEVIKQFEEYINHDTKEVPTLHNFLKKFSWLLDPRILEFRDEVTYSQLLKESYPEEELDEKNRRIDFLCSNAIGGILYVIEIKRSTFEVDVKALEQAYDYGSFLKNRYGSQTGFSKVVCFVVGGIKSDDYRFVDKERTYSREGIVFVKTYRELLIQSQKYHQEFIDTYETYKDK